MPLLLGVLLSQRALVAILIGPGGPMPPWAGHTARLRLTLRSSSAPEGRCHHSLGIYVYETWTVAILIGPGGPMPRHGVADLRQVGGVAILIGPGGPMPPLIVYRTAVLNQLRSSSAPEGRCHQTTIYGPGTASFVAILIGPGGPMPL